MHIFATIERRDRGTEGEGHTHTDRPLTGCRMHNTLSSVYVQSSTIQLAAAGVNTTQYQIHTKCCIETTEEVHENLQPVLRSGYMKIMGCPPKKPSVNFCSQRDEKPKTGTQK